MSKVQNKGKPVNKPKAANTKNVKKATSELDVKDFFTEFLSKKVRNLNKKITEITDLKKKQKEGEELRPEQVDKISKREEVQGQIDECNNIRNTYLEAYVKRDDEPVEKQPEAVVEVKKEAEVPQVNEEEVEARGVQKACNFLSKWMVNFYMLRSEGFVQQFSEKSGMNLNELQNMLKFNNQTVRLDGNNWNRTENLSTVLNNLVNKTPSTTSIENEGFTLNVDSTYEQLNDLTVRITNNDSFLTFTGAKVVKVVEAPVVVQKSEVRKDSEPVKTRSRLESEVQQELFMANDDEESADEHNVGVIVEEKNTKTVEMVESKQQKPVDAPKPVREEKVKVAPPKREERKQKNPNDIDDEDEWITNTTGKPKVDQVRGGRRGGRGTGRGGRGYYKKDGVEGERPRGGRGGNYQGKRPWTEADGERRPERREGDREWKDGGDRVEGEFREKRGEYRGRGGRGEGRGGRGNYRGNRNNDQKQYNDGEKRTYQNGNTDGGDAQLKEVGTKETLVQNEAPVETKTE